MIKLAFIVIKTLSDKITQQTPHVSVLKKDFTWKIENVNNLNAISLSTLIGMKFFKKTIVHALMVHIRLVILVDAKVTLPWSLINVSHAMLLIVSSASKQMFVLAAKINTILNPSLTNVNVKKALHNHQLKDASNVKSMDVNNVPLKMFVLPV